MITKPRLTREQCRALAAAAGRHGRTAAPMSTEDRNENYLRQRPSGNLTARQWRRWMKKRNRLAGRESSLNGGQR